jgi:hypothetical protein
MRQPPLLSGKVPQANLIVEGGSAGSGGMPGAADRWGQTLAF